MQWLEEDLRRVVYVDEIQDVGRMRRESAYRARTYAAIDRKMEFLV